MKTPAARRRAAALLVLALIASTGCGAPWLEQPRPSGCPAVVEGSASVPVALLLTPPALVRDAVDLPLRSTVPILTLIDPGHPVNYVFAPFVVLAQLHAWLFFGGTEIGSEDAIEFIFDPMTCGWAVAPNLHTLW